MARKSYKYTREALDKFGKNTVKVAKSNLTKGDNRASNELYNSVKYKIIGKWPNMRLEILTAPHGDVLDKGFSGVIENIAGTPYKVHGNVDYNTRQGQTISHFLRIHYLDIREWVVDKGIATYDNSKTPAFFISKRLREYGRKPTKWLTRAKKSQQPKMIKALEIAMAKDIANNLKNMFKR